MIGNHVWKLRSFDDLKVIKWILIKEFHRWVFYDFRFNHLLNFLDLGWYLVVMHCSVPVMLCNATNFIRKLPSLAINIGIFLCQYMRQTLETIVFSRGYICRNQSITLSKFHCRYYEAHLIFSFFSLLLASVSFLHRLFGISFDVVLQKPVRNLLYTRITSAVWSQHFRLLIIP